MGHVPPQILIVIFSAFLGAVQSLYNSQTCLVPIPYHFEIGVISHKALKLFPLAAVGQPPSPADTLLGSLQCYPPPLVSPRRRGRGYPSLFFTQSTPLASGAGGIFSSCPCTNPGQATEWQIHWFS